MGRTHTSKRVPKSDIVVNRPVGKPKKVWINAVEEESREIQRVKN
jgi:hypothetical protein